MIAIGSDHGGYKLKEEIKRYLEEKEIEYEDCGTFSKDRADYPEIAKTVALDYIGIVGKYGPMVQKLFGKVGSLEIKAICPIVAAAQEPDGYLYTSRTMNPKHPHEWAGSKRWENALMAPAGQLVHHIVAQLTAHARYQYLHCL